MCSCEENCKKECLCGGETLKSDRDMMDKFTDTSFVGNRNYIVEFPEEFGIEPYCVQRFWTGNDSSVVMELIEPYEEGMTMPEKLDKISKCDDLVVGMAVMTPDNKAYYTEKFYVKDRSFTFRRQTIGYDIPGLVKWSVLFEFAKHTIVTKVTCDDGAVVFVEKELKTI